ncbi:MULTISPECIES: helix-turn-helix domain-containing protein [Clostridium]|uniref:Helix-turn-helix transcriptional regulator n=1 Tax=Clostridium beijerinckii TaxID=1520 RepID=A0AAW3W8Z3_CLOBE|nr:MULTISPECIES: helix-turn-helix transcriptional regulator [Clostridium]MBC2456164.1 helix-turn-helix transcriptional regulator [Clostridium beijerinckii]MBC2475449.1 helix-turn-helix transcriptional regulator [Clostridium beijerinckii]MBN7575444.1 helix-turn-helix transcriptional regulator [Clostridium beijerinckii]MBN7580755.1 helix-turn-helix transcriptional regulator [Clostridium beijerinckii]MBN7585208.1 helix-turn-helix transcriptional regulator [Clostridium beijerinckii]
MNEFLLKFRKEKKLTQEEFSDLLGITLTYYSKIELGLRNPSYNFLNKFKSAFPNASIDDIFFRQYVHEMCS